MGKSLQESAARPGGTWPGGSLGGVPGRRRAPFDRPLNWVEIECLLAGGNSSPAGTAFVIGG